MNVAIVDDMAPEREATRAFLTEYFSRYKSMFLTDFFEFESGDALLSRFEPGKFQLILIDVYMEGTNGVDTARRIYREDKNACLIFLTSSEEHIHAGYSVRALQYVSKPVSRNKAALTEGLDFFMERFAPDSDGFFVTAGQAVRFLPYRSLLYADCVLRKTHLHLKDGRILEVSESIGEISDSLLRQERFLESSRNLIINMEEVKTPLPNDFLLSNGETVPITQRRKTKIKRVYMDYFLKNGGA